MHIHLCFPDTTSPVGKTCIDIDIPDLIRDPFHPIPPVEKWWIRGDGIDPEGFRDLSIIATIERLSSQLTPKMQTIFQNPIAKAIGNIALPSSMKIEMGAKAIK
jgi:hypothetical protein